MKNNDRFGKAELVLLHSDSGGYASRGAVDSLQIYQWVPSVQETAKS